MSCYGGVRRDGDRTRDRQETLRSTIVIEAIPRYPPQRVLREAVIPGGATGRASLNFHTKRDATADAICDRLLHNAHRIVLKGPSRRKETKLD
jgi:hypothetical protein